MAREDLHFRLRLPEDVKILIEEAASANSQSMTAEIVQRLRRSFDADEDRERIVALWTENDELRSALNSQAYVVQRLTEAHETLAILAKSIGEVFLAQGNQSDALKILAQGLIEMKVDPSTTLDGDGRHNYGQERARGDDE